MRSRMKEEQLTLEGRDHRRSQDHQSKAPFPPHLQDSPSDHQTLEGEKWYFDKGWACPAGGRAALGIGCEAACRQRGHDQRRSPLRSGRIGVGAGDQTLRVSVAGVKSVFRAKVVVVKGGRSVFRCAGVERERVMVRKKLWVVD